MDWVIHGLFNRNVSPFAPIHQLANHDIFIYAIYLCLAFLMIKAFSFMSDIKDIDRYIARELNNKYIGNYSFVKWAQIGDRFKYIIIALFLIFLAARFSTYLYLTKTRLLVAMVVLFIFSVTRLYKFRDYINEMYRVYDAISQSREHTSLGTINYFNISRKAIEAITLGFAFAFTTYLLSLETLFIRLLMYVISFGCIYFTGTALYYSRGLFLKVLIDIDSFRKSAA